MSYYQLKNILYVFGSGRLKRINSKEIDSEEFFYGFFYLLKKYKNVDAIEMNKEVKLTKIIPKIFLFFDKSLRKISTLPFYMSLICNSSNFKKIKKSDILIVTNDRLGLSILPMVILTKIFKKIDLYIIVMGLFNKDRSNKLINFFFKVIISFFLNIGKKFIFLGEGEYKNACLKHPNFNNKFKLVPFCVDTKFWKDDNINFKKKDRILFIGNDGNRDFDLVLKIAKELKNYNFDFVTSHKFIAKNISSNVNLINANWNDYLLSDNEIKEFYKKARFTILPIKNTLQPSGQSVALQSMSMGVPVIITKTEGFWDFVNFENNTNILFVENNDLETWTKKIIELYENLNLIEVISQNSRKTIDKSYDIEIFNNKIEEIILS